ncbi:MAG: DUF2218 domain-containing protein [Intrasporangiaceae bacterium]|nr:DUF2218 domain-containing protein [Intrasporangiaceae bacterium]
MRKSPVQEKPPYPLSSVDNALRLLQLLRDGGAWRLSDCAEELAVAPSTAHRLLSMLVYRGFAMRDDDRNYVAGPALGAPVVDAPWVPRLREIAADILRSLSQDLGETVNLVHRVGSSVRFIESVQTSAAMRVGDRTGSVLSAAEASGGKALLALEPPERVRSLFAGGAAGLSGQALSEREIDRLARDLEGVRRVGYAVNREDTEPGVGAVGVALVLPDGHPLAGLSVSAPVRRLSHLLTPPAIARLFAARDDLTTRAAHLDPPLVASTGRDLGLTAPTAPGGNGAMTHHKNATSEAVVATDRAARYGKQLASHLGRKATAEWDEENGSGAIVFGEDRGHAELVVQEDGLLMRVYAAAGAEDNLEDVLGRHLVRFGSRDELVVSWTRADGSAGTEQRLTEDS